MEFPKKRYVEAIEDGKIVYVSEDYARKEDLFVLKKIGEEGFEQQKMADLRLKDKQMKIKNGEISRPLMDDFRRPMKQKKSQITEELVYNFHWEIKKKRRLMDLSRKQLAIDINEPEKDVMMVENGMLPREDFVLINKIQQRLGINLRKDRKDFSQEMRKLVDENPGNIGKEIFENESKGKTRKIRDYRLLGRKNENKSEGGTPSLLGDDIELIE